MTPVSARWKRMVKILYRYVAKDYRIYFEVIEGKVIVHRVLHANSLNDFPVSHQYFPDCRGR